MLTDLDDTQFERRQQGARTVHAVASGLGPLIGILLPLLPFAFEGAVFTLPQAAAVAVALGVGLLASFGAYMGSISGQRWYLAAVRTGLAGLVAAAINVVLPG